MIKSNINLIKIGAIGGVATIFMGMLARNKIESNVKSAPFYKEALKVVRTHPAAVFLLGEPIKESRIKISDTKKNFVKENVASFQVPLKGTKQKGTAFITAEKQSDENEWILNRIELEVENIPNKRLIVVQKENK